MRSQNTVLPPPEDQVIDLFDGILINGGYIEMTDTKDANGQVIQVPAKDPQGDPIAGRLAFRDALIENVKALPPAQGAKRSEKGAYPQLLAATVTLPFDPTKAAKGSVEREVYDRLIALVTTYCGTGTTQPAQKAVMGLKGDKVLLKGKILTALGDADGVWISNSHDPLGDRMDSVKARWDGLGTRHAAVVDWTNANTQDAAMAAEALSYVQSFRAERNLELDKIEVALQARLALGNGSVPTPELAEGVTVE
jgi:hypothetical protein